MIKAIDTYYHIPLKNELDRAVNGENAKSFPPQAFEKHVLQFLTDDHIIGMTGMDEEKFAEYFLPQ